MRTFTWLLVTQTISLIGSHLSGFGLSVWIFQMTGSTTLSGLVYVATIVPQLLLAPFAGVVVDRHGPRAALLLGYAGAGACTVALLLAASSGGGPNVRAVLVLVGLASCFRAAEFPGMQVATVLLVSGDRRGRANGLVQLSFALPLLVGPVVATRMLSSLGVSSILLTDLVSFVFGVAVLFALSLPRANASAPGRVLGELGEAWRFIRERPGLLALLFFFAVLNFNLGMVQVLMTPLVLGFADAAALGTVLSAGGAGVLAGALVMSVWGGPERRIRGVLGSALAQGAVFLLGAARPSVALAACGAFGALFAVPVMAASNLTIWQRKVPLGLQGRVAAVRSVLAIGAMPVGIVLAGPLADRVFEPSMREGGALARAVGPVLGIGPGRGVAALLVVLGLATIALALAASLHPRIRGVEDELSDHEQAIPIAAVSKRSTETTA